MISRRTLVLSAAGTVASTLPAQALMPTPAQTPGPFFPDRLPRESDFDLTTISGGPRAEGETIELIGQVLDVAGRPVPGAVVEMWQANTHGRYWHSHDTSSAPLDPNFQGYGTVRSDAEGRYRFRTIKPGLYTGRTRHLHFYIGGPGFERMPTQMYFAGEPMNARDFLYASIRDPQARASVTVEFSASGGSDVRLGRFDIVLGT